MAQKWSLKFKSVTHKDNEPESQQTTMKPLNNKPQNCGHPGKNQKAVIGDIRVPPGNVDMIAPCLKSSWLGDISKNFYGPPLEYLTTMLLDRSLLTAGKALSVVNLI